ncbi:sensor histidine kinase [Chitinophaga silvisoli]|nr:histidine kinase [Chitinophaga silvisoli]
MNYGINLIAYHGDAYIGDTAVKYSIAALIFYSCSLFIFPKFFNYSRWYLLLPFMLILLVISFIGRELCSNYLYPLWMTDKSPYTHGESFIMHLWWYSQYSIWGWVYWYAKENIRKKWETTKLEKEIILSDFNALKAQVDPHFLYNTLNYFYSKALDVSEPLADAIVDLSDVMRYSIEKKEDENGQVLLIDEIYNIEKLLSLFNYRFNDLGQVIYSKSGNLDKLRVPPYILTIPIENVLKHGDTTQEIIIDIDYDQLSSSLLIYIANSKNVKEASSTGIGLENLKKRLHYHYGDKQKLTVNEDAQFFEITIEIMY